MKLYLYGKRIFLSDLIESKKGIRFSDIAHYSIMENSLMRDNELEKKFVFDKDRVKIEVNGILISPLSMVGHPSVLMQPDRCFCVCFSTKKNDVELFERFEADVCVEIDLERLLEVLNPAVSRFAGMEVIHGPVVYYPELMADPLPDLRAALFYKRDAYKVESEYRVALTIPRHQKRFKSVEGVQVEIFSDNPNDLRHLFVNGTTPEINSHYVLGAHYL
ncbi:hypothetical protein [Pseudomonas oryziphila]|uniref:Uncharacterized protein n=1 Tax=Pseudomonas oryziphila TaxID=2894079 RepID=A0ABM7CSW7_9PSED|nr:hypothetical protein [Pseudomonas oryziphila]AZL74557.1 hypothetical protein EI693_16355 [Pseudomonas oryziphila]